MCLDGRLPGQLITSSFSRQSRPTITYKHCFAQQSEALGYRSVVPSPLCRCIYVHDSVCIFLCPFYSAAELFRCLLTGPASLLRVPSNQGIGPSGSTSNKPARSSSVIDSASAQAAQLQAQFQLQQQQQQQAIRKVTPVCASCSVFLCVLFTPFFSQTVHVIVVFILERIRMSLTHHGPRRLPIPLALVAIPGLVLVPL